MSTPFQLLVGGVWIPLTGTARETPRTLTRARSSWTSFGGVQRFQRAQSGPRSWTLSYSFKSASTVRWLALAAQGLAGDVWLLDSAAAQSNMLRPRTCVGTDATQPLVAVDNGATLRAFNTSEGFTRKLRGGVSYRLTGWTTHTAGSTIGTYNIGAGAVNIPAPAGSGSRRFSVTIAPASDTTITVAWTVAGKTTGAGLTEGAVVGSIFLPGENTPCRVAVDDPTNTLSLYTTATAPRSSYTVQVDEVG